MSWSGWFNIGAPAGGFSEGPATQMLGTSRGYLDGAAE